MSVTWLTTYVMCVVVSTCPCVQLPACGAPITESLTLVEPKTNLVEAYILSWLQSVCFRVEALYSWEFDVFEQWTPSFAANSNKMYFACDGDDSSHLISCPQPGLVQEPKRHFMEPGLHASCSTSIESVGTRTVHGNTVVPGLLPEVSLSVSLALTYEGTRVAKKSCDPKRQLQTHHWHSTA